MRNTFTAYHLWYYLENVILCPTSWFRFDKDGEIRWVNFSYKKGPVFHRRHKINIHIFTVCKWSFTYAAVVQIWSLNASDVCQLSRYHIRNVTKPNKISFHIYFSSRSRRHEDKIWNSFVCLTLSSPNSSIKGFLWYNASIEYNFYLFCV